MATSDANQKAASRAFATPMFRASFTRRPDVGIRRASNLLRRLRVWGSSSNQPRFIMVRAVGWLSDSRLHGISCPVLLISLFNGIGGTFRIYDILGVIPHGRIAVDVSKQGNRVTRTTWPDVIELHDVNNITKDEIRRWANLFAHVSEVHVFGSFPCVHLSSARANRLNLKGEGSNLFWKLVEILQWIHEIFGSFCKVKHCVENVASMDEDAIGWPFLMSSELCQ